MTKITEIKIPYTDVGRKIVEKQIKCGHIYERTQLGNTGNIRLECFTYTNKFCPKCGKEL